jgi:hypothetical protein
MANTVNRAVPAVLRPWTITAELGADADCASSFQKPEPTTEREGFGYCRLPRRLRQARRVVRRSVVRSLDVCRLVV